MHSLGHRTIKVFAFSTLLFVLAIGVLLACGRADLIDMGDAFFVSIALGLLAVCCMVVAIAWAMREAGLAWIAKRKVRNFLATAAQRTNRP